jgi:hypothetical protein
MGTDLLQLVLDYCCCSDLSHPNKLMQVPSMVNIMAPTPPRYEWYWTAAMVRVCIFAKALQDDNLKVISLNGLYVLVALFSPIGDIYFVNNSRP